MMKETLSSSPTTSGSPTSSSSSSSSSAANVSTSVATALSDGLERLVTMASSGSGLGRESLPVLESFLHATDLLVESAEAVGASTKERASRDAIFNYGRELKAEAGSLRELAQTLAQTPAIGQTVETKQSVINSLFKIGKLTANLMQAEEDADQKVLSRACKDCASSAKILVSRTRRSHNEMIEAARVFAQSCVELVKALTDIAQRYADPSPKHKEELLQVANQIKTTSPKLIEAVKVAHFNPGNTKNMEEALVAVKVLAGEISRAITLSKGPAFTTEFKMPSLSPSNSPPSSSPSTSSFSTSPSSPSISSPSTSRAGGGGLGVSMRRGAAVSSSSGSTIRKRTITDSQQGMDVLMRARAMSQAVTLKLKIEKELDVRDLEANSNCTASGEEPASTTTEGHNNGMISSPALSRSTADKEGSKHLLRISKLEVENKRLREENEELKRRFESFAGNQERSSRESELRQQLSSLTDDNSRLRQEVERLNNHLRAYATQIQRIRDMASTDVSAFSSSSSCSTTTERAVYP